MKVDLGYSYRKGSSRNHLWNTKRLNQCRSIYSTTLLKDFDSNKYIISIDEWSFNRHLRNTYSWLPKGVSAAIVNSNCTGRCSLILALTIEGEYLGMIWSETVNHQVYCEFLKVLAYWLNWLKIRLDKNVVVTWDNAAIHRSYDTIKLIRRLGFYTHFLPPYTPELQCVELAFKLIKGYIRLNYSNKVLDFNDKSGRYAIINALASLDAENLSKLWLSTAKSWAKFILN